MWWNTSHAATETGLIIQPFTDAVGLEVKAISWWVHTLKRVIRRISWTDAFSNATKANFYAATSSE